MKFTKAIAALLLAALMILAASAALAGSSYAAGIYSSSVLGDNTTFEAGTTTITIDTDTVFDDMYKYSIHSKGTLRFDSDGSHFLMVKKSTPGSACITADERIELLSGTEILFPHDGKISADGKMITDKDGKPASTVIIGSKYWYVSMDSVLYASEIPKEKFILLTSGADLYLDKDIMVRGIHDRNHGYSMMIKPYGSVDAKFTCYAGGEKPISVGSFGFDTASLTLSRPVYGKCEGGTVLQENGKPAAIIEIYPKGQYIISSTGCYAYSEQGSLDSANKDDLVYVYPHNAPADKYFAGVTSAEITAQTETDMDGYFFYSFKMPGKNVSIKADYQPQTAYTFDLRGKTKIDVLSEPGLLGSMNELVWQEAAAYDKIDGKYYFDLDGDHSWDIVEPYQNIFEVASTCNLTKWTSKSLNQVQFSPLTFIFRDDPVPSTVTVGTLKYKLSGSSAIVIGPKSKNTKKHTIPASITVGGKTYKVTEIRAGAFKGIKKLTKITIGKNVKTIGKQAFYKCSKLKTIIIKTAKLTLSSVKSNAFKGISKTATFMCPKKKLNAYKKILLKRGASKTCTFR